MIENEPFALTSRTLAMFNLVTIIAACYYIIHTASSYIRMLRWFDPCTWFANHNGTAPACAPVGVLCTGFQRSSAPWSTICRCWSSRRFTHLLVHSRRQGVSCRWSYHLEPSSNGHHLKSQPIYIPFPPQNTFVCVIIFRHSLIQLLIVTSFHSYLLLPHNVLATNCLITHSKYSRNNRNNNNNYNGNTGTQEYP